MADGTIKPLEVELILKVQRFLDTLRTIATTVKGTSVTPESDPEKIKATGKALDDLITDLDKLSKTPAADTLKHVGDETEHSGQKAGQAHGMFGKLKESFADGLGTAAAILGLQNLSAKLDESFEKFEQQDEAEKGLEISMDDLGAKSDATVKNLEQFATARQGITQFADESTLKLLQFGKQFANISDPKRLKQFAVAVQNYAAATGKDLETASQKVASVLEGGGKLREFKGVNFKTGDMEANLDKFIGITEKKFSGFAEKIANSPAGAVKQWKNTLGDLEENVGRIMANIVQPIIPALKLLAAGFAEVTSFIAAGIQFVQKYGVVFGILLTIAGLFVIASKEEAISLAIKNALLAVSAERTSALNVITGIFNLTNAKKIVSTAIEIGQMVVSNVVSAAKIVVTTAINVVLAIYNINTYKNIAAFIIENAQNIISNGLYYAKTAALGVVTGAQWLWNAALNANPISLIIIGVIAFVGILVLLYNKVEFVRVIVDALWKVLKIAFEFFINWLNPIGLAINLFKLLYEKVGFFRAAVDALVETFKAAKEWITGALHSIGDALGLTATEAEKTAERQKAAAESATLALDQQREAIKKLGAQYQGQNDQFSEDLAGDEKLLKRLRSELSQGILDPARHVLVPLTPEQREQHLKDITLYEDATKKMRTFVQQRADSDKKVEEDTAYVRPAEALDRIKKQADLFEKTIGKSGVSWGVAIAQMRKYIGEHREQLTNGVQADRDAMIAFNETIQDYTNKQKDTLKAGRLAVSNELKQKLQAISDSADESKKKLKLAIAENVGPADSTAAYAAIDKKAADERLKIQREFYAAAHIEETDELTLKIVEIGKKYEEQNRVLQEGLDVGLAKEQQADKARKSHAMLQQREELQAVKDFIQSKAKAAEEESKVRVDLATKDLQQTYRVQGRSPLDAQRDSLLLAQKMQIESLNAQQANSIAFATANIKVESDRAAAIREIQLQNRDAILQIQQQTSDAVLKVTEEQIKKEQELADLKTDRTPGLSDADKQIEKLDHAQTAELKLLNKQYDLKTIAREEYEQRISEIATRYANSRFDITKSELEKENVLYDTMLGTIGKAFTLMTDSFKTALAHWIGYEQKEKQKDTENDLKLKELDKEKTIKSLEDEVKQSKISYEEYLLKKQKAEEDYNQASKDSEEDRLTFVQEMEKSSAETALDMSAKLTQQYVEDSLTHMIADQGKATSSLIASIFAWAPFPLNVVLAGGAFAIIAGALSAAFSSVTKKKSKAMRGMVHDPDKGGEYVYMEGSHEGGHKEFVAPEHEFLQYAREELGPKVIKAVTAGMTDTSSATSRGGSTTPSVYQTISWPFPPSVKNPNGDGQNVYHTISWPAPPQVRDNGGGNDSSNVYHKITMPPPDSVDASNGTAPSVYHTISWPTPPQIRENPDNSGVGSVYHRITMPPDSVAAAGDPSMWMSLLSSRMQGTNSAFARSFQQIASQGGPVPRVSPTLQVPSAIRQMNLKEMAENTAVFSKAVHRLVDEGFEVRTRIKAGDIVGAARSANNAVNGRYSTRGGGI